MGKERGYLLYDEVNDLLPEGICSSDELDSIFSLFGSAGIEVIDSEQKFQDEGKKDDKRGEDAGEEGEFDLAAISLDKTNDPVRMYLREMGTVHLLSSEGEVPGCTREIFRCSRAIAYRSRGRCGRWK